MEKEATDLLRLALLSMLGGAGTYSVGRLLKDLPNAGSPPPKDENVMEITLPAGRMPKHAEVSDWLNPALAVGIGGTLGFGGTSALYEHLKRKQLEKQMKTVNDQYLQALTQANKKIASETPHVDDFLCGMIGKIGETIEKYAQEDWYDSQNILNWFAARGKNLWDDANKTPVADAIKASMVLTALGTGGLTYGLANKLDKAKTNANKQTSYPTEIHVNLAR